MILMNIGRIFKFVGSSSQPLFLVEGQVLLPQPSKQAWMLRLGVKRHDACEVLGLCK